MAKKLKVKVRPPADIKEDGFSLEEVRKHIDSFALLSLRIALRSYFSTYQAMCYCLHGVVDLLEDVKKEDLEKKQKETDFLHSTEYCALYGQTIVHFQHFAELVCKDFLRREHPLLAITLEGDPVLLLKLAKQQDVQPSDYENIITIEFTRALDRMIKLLNAGKLDASAACIKDAKPLLEALNQLRNRLLHRGTLVLRYRALDELVGAHLLPFVKKVTALPKYAGREGFWKHHELKCGVDPIDTLIADWDRGEYNVLKVAMLKELGRAAYELPAWGNTFGDLLEADERRRGERLAAAELKERVGSDVRECPVCGVKAFVQYEDFETGQDADGTAWAGPRYPYRYQCARCSLDIGNNLDNPSAYGLPIPDLWPNGSDGS